MKSVMTQAFCTVMGVINFLADSHSPVWAVWCVGSLVIYALRRNT